MDGHTYGMPGWIDGWMDGRTDGRTGGETPNVLPATNSLDDDRAYELNTHPRFARRCAYRRLDYSAVDFIGTYLRIAVYAPVSVISVDALTAVSLCCLYTSAPRKLPLRRWNVD